MDDTNRMRCFSSPGTIHVLKLENERTPKEMNSCNQKYTLHTLAGLLLLLPVTARVGISRLLPLPGPRKVVADDDLVLYFAQA